MSWAQRGVSPVKAAVLGIVLLLVASYFIFTKALPFASHYTISAVVRSSNLLAPGSPVRIGGVDVGKVSSVGRYRNTDLGLVTMQIDSGGRPIHADATIWIRPRLFLEGNFYVQLSPGTAQTPELRDGGTIPVAHTSDPVQLDQLLDALPADVRLQLQQALQGFGQALDTQPTLADDARQDPAVRGLTGAQAINKTFDTSPASLRDSAIDARALTGPTGAALAQTISGFGRASAGLARADGQLSALISDFDRTMQATAAQQQGLRQTVALLGPTAASADAAFGALNAGFPATERFSDALAGSLPKLPATIAAADPWLAQSGPLLSRSELRGLLEQLAPASGELAHLTHGQLQFLPQIDAFNRCITRVFLPTGNLVVPDGPLSTGVPNYQEFWYTMVAQAAEGQGADGNGNFLRIGAPGGQYPVESGQTNYYGNADTGFALMPAPPLRTRPAYPNRLPPLQRTVPCYTQPVPNLGVAASTGPADGSRPNAPPPPGPQRPGAEDLLGIVSPRRKPMTRTARELRGQARTIVLMALLAVFGVGVGIYLVVHQRIVWPSWVPVLGHSEYVLKAQVTAVSGVLPGQGQAVTISGVTVGQISGLALHDGTPTLTMEIDPQYAGRVYPNATVLLRPKTGLEDMVAELDPGTPAAGHSLHSGATLSAANTLPPVQFDEILAQLDADTRGELMQLISNAGQALGDGGGPHLADVFRRFDPLSRDVETASHLVSLRAVELTRVMGNLSKIATTLGDNETQLTAFVRGNEGVWHAFAQQDQNLQRTIGLLPGALRATDTALGRATTLGHTLQSAFGQLVPSAQSLGPTLADLRPFFTKTTPVIRDQLRPFSIKAQPTARLLAPATRDLARSTPGLTTLAKELDNIVNELAYKPKSGQSYLFDVPWANHDTNSVLSTQDGVGPVRQSMLEFTCGTLSLLQGFIANPNQNPTLTTLIELLNTPSYAQYCNGTLPK